MAKKTSRKPMTLVVISPEADRIHMALMMGATAAATGQPTTFFFSKAAVKFVTKDGWEAFKASDGMEANQMDKRLEETGIADTALLLDGLSALNARFVVCESALREYAIDAAKLITRPAVEISGIADVLEKGSGGDWLTF